MSAERFKRGSFGSVFPSVAGPALGGFGGRMIASKYHLNPEAGMLLGGITGGTVGKLVEEKVKADAATIPPGAPYALDASSQEIPQWALQGARLLQPQMKQGEHAEREPIGDVLKGEIPGFPVAEAAVSHGPGAAARTFGGMAGGGLVGGGLGALGGYGIEKLIGHQVNRIPGIGMSLPDLLASIGGTIGATKGLRYMKA